MKFFCKNANSIMFMLLKTIKYIHTLHNGTTHTPHNGTTHTPHNGTIHTPHHSTIHAPHHSTIHAPHHSTICTPHNSTIHTPHHSTIHTIHPLYNVHPPPPTQRYNSRLFVPFKGKKPKNSVCFLLFFLLIPCIDLVS